MLNASSSQTPSAAFPKIVCGEKLPECGQSALLQSIQPCSESIALLGTLDNDVDVEWDEQHIVFLHWRLLEDISDLANPDTPLEEKFDTLRWIFTERDKESRPFSFVNCLSVVGCSPLSPAPYVGLVDADEMRNAIRAHARTWLDATLNRYPCWVREAVVSNPEWIETQLTKNPQWINEQVKTHGIQGDLFM